MITVLLIGGPLDGERRTLEVCERRIIAEQFEDVGFIEEWVPNRVVKRIQTVYTMRKYISGTPFFIYAPEDMSAETLFKKLLDNYRP